MPRHFITWGLPPLAVWLAGCANAPAPAPAPAPVATPAPARASPAAPPAAAALPPGMPDLTRARPAIHAFSAAEIDRVSGRSGLTDCFWVGTLSLTTFNILIPDTGLVYWITQFKLSAGAKLELKGQYPHARNLSFNSYNPVG